MSLGATLAGWRHGVPSEQHSSELAGGAFCPSGHREGRGGAVEPGRESEDSIRLVQTTLGTCEDQMLLLSSIS